VAEVRPLEVTEGASRRVLFRDKVRSSEGGSKSRLLL
jgi:hypothetical protein